MAEHILPAGTAVVGFLGAASSSVPAVAILTSRSLRNQPMFQTVCNLSVSESWFLFCGGVFGTYNVLGGKMTPFLCGAAQSHNLSIAIGGSTALLVVSVERFLSVVHGLRYQALLTPWRMKILLLFPWFIMGVAWVTLTSFASKMILDKFGPASLRCRYMDVMPPQLRLAATGTALTIYVLIVLLNVFISRVAARHQRDINHQRQQVGLERQENVSAYWGVLRVTIIYILVQVSAMIYVIL